MHKHQQLNGFSEIHPQETAVVLIDYDTWTSHARSRNAKQFLSPRLNGSKMRYNSIQKNLLLLKSCCDLTFQKKKKKTARNGKRICDTVTS